MVTVHQTKLHLYSPPLNYARVVEEGLQDAVLTEQAVLQVTATSLLAARSRALLITLVRLLTTLWHLISFRGEGEIVLRNCVRKQYWLTGCNNRLDVRSLKIMWSHSPTS